MSNNIKKYEFFEKDNSYLRTYRPIKKAITLEEGWRKTFEKWNLIINGNKVCSGVIILRTCGLCDVFIANLGCAKCPIEKAGFPYCENKEYEDWQTAQSYDNSIDDWYRQIDLAKIELKFLKNVFNSQNKEGIE